MDQWDRNEAEGKKGRLAVYEITPEGKVMTDLSKIEGETRTEIYFIVYIYTYSNSIPPRRGCFNILKEKVSCF